MHPITAFVMPFVPAFPTQTCAEERPQCRHGEYLPHRLPWTARPQVVYACIAVTVFTVATLLNVAVAQAAPAQRINGSIDASALTKIPGHGLPLARAEFDQGKVDPSMPMHLTMTFKMTAEQQAALDALLAAQQQRGSPDYQR